MGRESQQSGQARFEGRSELLWCACQWPPDEHSTCRIERVEAHANRITDGAAGVASTSPLVGAAPDLEPSGVRRLQR